MSACSDFAEHVWKPGSCKNCFHPLSAHRKTAGGLGGSSPATCSKSSLGGDEEAGLTSPSPYTKPTIAVKPTMMSLDNDSVADVNMNIEQENTKSPVERLGLKKLLGLSSLYIDSSVCSKAALRSPETKKDFNNCLPTSILPKDPAIISNIFITQEEGRGPQSFRRDPGGDAGTTPTRTKSTYKETGVTRTKSQQSRQPSVDIPFSVDMAPSSPAAVHSHDVSVLSGSEMTTSPSRASMDTSNNSLTPPRLSSPTLSKQTSFSGSSCSYRSSTDSLPGEERSGGRQPGSPRSPPDTGSSQSVPSSPNGLNSEPIYAESTKKKRKAQGTEGRSGPESLDRAEASELEVTETQRATITVMAARAEENKRTFYLSSPDSSVSTRCHFSPAACKDPPSPAFCWPSPSHSSPSLASEAALSPTSRPKPQRSPPIPPKRTNRTPKLGTSSLSSSASSPVPLPELPRLGASSLSSSISSPVPLPELSMLFFVTSRDLKAHADAHSAAAPERWAKPPNPGPGWSCRIVEEEEEEEREAEKNKAAASPAPGLVNGATVWTESSNCKAQSGPAAVTEPGTAPPGACNNGGCQRDAKGNGAVEHSERNGSMPSRQALHGSSSELGRGATNHEPNPPPPPPKKLHRACGKMSGSNAELDRFGESPASSPRGLGSAGLPTASTDSLAADTSSRDSLRMSPISRSPVVSAPASPNPPPCGGAQPPPLPEKKTVNRTVSAPDTNGKSFLRGYPRLSFTGSESNVCRPGDARASLPSSPVDPRPIFSSNESLERCHAPPGHPSRSRTLDEPLKVHGRLGVHCRSSITCSSSPQLSAPFPGSEAGPAANLGSTMQLQTLLSNIDNREGVYSKLGGLYAESLRRLALKCEDHFTRVQRKPLRFEESSWSLFRLTSNKPSCNSGDAVYYSAACASDPSNSYAVKICKNPSAEAKQGHLYGLSVQQSVPPHFNLQQDCGHFLACVPQSMLPSDEASAAPPGPQRSQPSERERVVVITCEIPQRTAADFAREWEGLHKAQPEVYERRVCFLLLQLCNGLEHLKEHGVTHRDLCLENLLLVPHHHRPAHFPQQAAPDDFADPQRHLPRLLVSNFAKAKRRSSEDAAFAGGGDPRVKRDHARLAPEIVSAAQYRKFDEFQTGILIYELLHQPNPFEMSPALKEQDYRCEDLPPIPPLSLYSAGLQRLAQLLLQPDPIKRIHIQEAKRVLQSLLWGPRRDLMEQQRERHRQGGGFGPRHEGLLNWLDVKRALLMMKFAERSLEPERNAELEDWLCCQYFSSAHPLSLCHTAELLYSLK